MKRSAAGRVGRVLGWVTLAAATLAAAGCGYRTGGMFPQQYATVAAPIFENRTFEREVEFDLAAALVAELEQRTPYKVVSPAAADTVVQGSITAVDRRQISRFRDGTVPQEIEVTLTVDFEWRDLRTGRTLLERQGFAAVGRHIPTDPVGEPFEVAQHEAVQRLAREIVSSMRGDW